MVPRFKHWERVLGNNNYGYAAQGRSRLFPAPPQPGIRRQPYNQPSCLMAVFGYVAPHAQFLPRLNSLSPCVPNPPCHLPPPLPPPQDQTDSKETKSTSSGFNSEDGDSLDANCGSPKSITSSVHIFFYNIFFNILICLVTYVNSGIFL